MGVTVYSARPHNCSRNRARNWVRSRIWRSRDYFLSTPPTCQTAIIPFLRLIACSTTPAVAPHEPMAMVGCPAARPSASRWSPPALPVTPATPLSAGPPPNTEIFWSANREPILKIRDVQNGIDLVQAFHRLPRFFQPSGQRMACGHDGGCGRVISPSLVRRRDWPSFPRRWVHP